MSISSSLTHAPLLHFSISYCIRLLTRADDYPTNRGPPGEEVVDENFNLANARRRSNSSGLTTDINNFKTKFDVNENLPVFEEGLHGPVEEDDEELRKTDSSVSEHSSVDDKTA